MVVLKLPQWVIGEIDKIRRRFLWRGISETKKGYSLVNWQAVFEPKSVGGHGIVDLRTSELSKAYQTE